MWHLPIYCCLYKIKTTDLAFHHKQKLQIKKSLIKYQKTKHYGYLQTILNNVLLQIICKEIWVKGQDHIHNNLCQMLTFLFILMPKEITV